MNSKPVYIKNCTGKTITEIYFSHRYEEDVYDVGSIRSLAPNAEEAIGVARFWTGFMRMGKDYWWIRYNVDDKVYTCKADFYCTLTAEDAEADRPVYLEVDEDVMRVVCPMSNGCKVNLYETYSLEEMLNDTYTKSGLADATQLNDVKRAPKYGSY